MRKSRVLLSVIALSLIVATIAIFAFAAPSDLTVRKSTNFESSTVGAFATASDGKNPTYGNVVFQQGGRTGRVEIKSANGNKYALVTQTDKVGTSAPYAYMKAGALATVTKDSAGKVTAFTKSANDLTNFKYAMFELDVMSPTGKLPTGYISIEGRRVYNTSNNNYWNPDATSNIVRFGNSNGATYLYANFDSALKKYIDPSDFTKIQIIVENITTDASTNIEIQTHVYVNGEICGYTMFEKVPVSRERLLDIFATIRREVAVLDGENAEDVANRCGGLGFDKLEFIFALTVFEELGLVSFADGSLTVYRGVKAELTDSETYCKVRALQGN